MCIMVQELDRETFKCVAIRDRSPNSILELLIATGDTCASLKLVSYQCCREQV